MQAKSVANFLGLESDQLLTDDNDAAPCPCRRRYLGPGEYEDAELMFCKFGEKTERESKWRNRSCIEYCTGHAGKKITRNMSITAGLTMVFEEIVEVCISPGIDPI